MSGTIKDALSAREAARWDALVAELDRIEPDRTETAGPDDRTAKDVLIHLATWCDEAAERLAAIREGRYVERDFDADARNAQDLRGGRAVDVGRARVRAERARARMLAQWSAIATPSAPAMEWFAESGEEHYREHLGALAALAAAGVAADQRPGATARRTGLVAAEAEAWSELVTVVAAVPEDALERPGLTPDGWSVKDVMWHVAMWWEDSLAAVPRFADPTFDPDDATAEAVDALNRTWFEESRDLPLDVVRGRWSSARDHGVAAFGAITEPARVAERWFEECGVIHYEKHLIDLRRSANGRLRDPAPRRQ